MFFLNWVLNKTTFFSRTKYLSEKPIPDWKYEFFKHQFFQEPIFEAPIFQAPIFEAPIFEAPIFEAPIFEAPIFEAPILLKKNLNDVSHFCTMSINVSLL